ncbi:MAG: hypothetical protein GY788_14970 [bacterium]|nr:hypothetical protein [bacterium]
MRAVAVQHPRQPLAASYLGGCRTSVDAALFEGGENQFKPVLVRSPPTASMNTVLSDSSPVAIAPVRHQSRCIFHSISSQRLALSTMLAGLSSCLWTLYSDLLEMGQQRLPSLFLAAEWDKVKAGHA